MGEDKTKMEKECGVQGGKEVPRAKEVALVTFYNLCSNRSGTS
jgi:hypothetical protein